LWALEAAIPRIKAQRLLEDPNVQLTPDAFLELTLAVNGGDEEAAQLAASRYAMQLEMVKPATRIGE